MRLGPLALLWLAACTPTEAGEGGDDTGPGSADTGDSGTAQDPAFVLGVNLPWIEYAVDVHSTAWGDATLSTHPDEVLDRLEDLRAHGVHNVRWWLFGDGRGAPEFAPDGTPIPLTRGDELGDNFGLMLDLAEAADVTVMPVVLDFAWCSAANEVNGVTLGGHADVLEDPDKRAALVDGVLARLASGYGDHPALAAWDLFNEPEWAFEGEAYGLGDHCTPEDVRAYVDEATAAIGAVSDTPTTVGSASYAWMVEHWVDADPPLLQFHDYWEDLATLDAELGKPVLLGEFPTKGGDLSATLDTAWAGGFSGALPWSAYAIDDATELDLDELAAWAEAHDVGGAY